MTQNTNTQQNGTAPRIRYPNDLRLARRERGLTRKQVASIVGRSIRSIRRYEGGATLPPLLTALKLEVLFRSQLAGLYDRTYQALRTELRAKEEAVLAHRNQKGGA